MAHLTKREAKNLFRTEYESLFSASTFKPITTDGPLLRQTWIDWVDGMVRENRLPQRAIHWECPWKPSRSVRNYTMKTFPEWQYKFVAMHVSTSGWVQVTAGLHYLKGNKKPYFSVTCEGKDHGSEFCGCCHNDVLACWPELKPVVDLHLADMNGEPLHAVANAEYWRDQKDFDQLAKHLRLSTVKPGTLTRAYNAGGGSKGDLGGIVDMGAFVRVLRPGWKREAKRVIEVLGRLIENQE